MISLRDIKKLDAFYIFKWKQDPYLQEMALDPGYQTTLEEQEKDIIDTLESEYNEYKVILLNEEPIGYIRVDSMNQEKTIAWLRFALGEHRQFGYSEQALRIYIEDLFNRGFERIVGEVYENNIPSHKILLKLGFQKEAVKKQEHFNGTEHIDVLVYGLLKNQKNK